MLKFVQKWMRERSENAEIEEDGTSEKWTKCEDGLPSTDRKVEVIVFSPAREHYGRDIPAGMDICFAQFNPHVGWKMENNGIVVSWRDMSKDYRDMINNLDWAQFMLQHKA
jgi:hypothetical protein